MTSGNPLLVLVDGVRIDTVPVSDRGLQYGDGLFETLAVIAGAPRLWEHHWARLEAGCRRLQLNVPDRQVLQSEVQLVAAGQARVVVKVIITRGSGGRGYRPAANAPGRRIVSLHGWPEYPSDFADDGVCVRICRHRLSLNPGLAGIKHLHRLDQVLARAEWNDPAIAEGLMRDPDGRIIEGTMSNLFLGIDGRLLTPRLDTAGVRGVMRGWLIDRARALAITVDELELWPEDLAHADEGFLCNSILGIWPLAAVLDGGRYPAPGPLTRRLQKEVDTL